MYIVINKWEIGWATDTGLVRRDTPNQDSIAVVQPFLMWRPPLLLLADGMGGYTGGALASQIVVMIVRDAYKKSFRKASDNLELVCEAIVHAHEFIRDQGAIRTEFAHMGTTIAAAILDGEHLRIANVGDTRVYVVSARGVRQVSYDHSLVADLIREGKIPADEAAHHPDRNKLTRSLNAARDLVSPFSCTVALHPGERILLCTDGLWSSVTEEQIQQVVMQFEPQVAVNKLVQMANLNQGLDNISAIIARRRGDKPLFLNHASQETEAVK